MCSKKEQENNNDSINDSEKLAENFVKLIKKQFNDMRMSDTLSKLEPQWKCAIRKGKKNANKSKRNIQDEKQAQLHKEHIREQRFGIMHQGLKKLKYKNLQLNMKAILLQLVTRIGTDSRELF
jgi:hypothetical protein